MSEEITRDCWTEAEITDMRLEEEARELAELMAEQKEQTDDTP